MSNANYSKNNIAGAFLLAIVLFLLLIPVVSSINIPLESNSAGIVSLATIANVSPYTNYIRFFLLLFIPSLVAAIALITKPNQINKFWNNFVCYLNLFILFINHKTIFLTLLLFLICTWVINKNYQSLDWILTDAFHEGEYLGFLPNFRTLDQPFLGSFMVHGFGLDVLTSLIANHLAEHFNTIALTRLLRMTEGTIGYVGCYWIIWEIVCSLTFKSPRYIIFGLASIFFTILDGSFFDYFTGVHAGRDTVFILQTALTVRFFRLVSTSKLSKPAWFLPIIIGASLPVSILYVYDRAIYFLLVYLFACGLSLCFGRRFFLTLFSRSALGFAIALISITVILGKEQLLEILFQIFFWIRSGRYISFNVMPSLNWDSILIWTRLGLATLTQVLGIIYLVSTYRATSSLGGFLRQKFLLIIILFNALIYMRIALDRPDYANYAGSAALMSVLLLIYILLEVFKTYFEARITQLLLNPLAKQLAVLLTVLVVLMHPLLNPFLSLDKLKRIYFTHKIPDGEIVKADFWQAAKIIKPEVERSPCFFTLNQQGLWYYLFNKPSCSKFSIVYYARTTQAQEKLIEDLDTQKPNIILFGSSYTNTFEGIPISDGIPIIYHYILNHYKPYTEAESEWFWQRNEQPPLFTQDKSAVGYGNVNSAISTKILRGDRVFLRGTAMLPNRDRQADAVYLSYGENNQLLEVAQVNKKAKWKVPIPTLSLPLGKHILRVWSYDAASNRLVQIGEDIKIDLII